MAARKTQAEGAADWCFLATCREVFKGMRAHAEAKLIWKLNPILRGWTNDHKSEASKQRFHDVDNELYKMQRR